MLRVKFTTALPYAVIEVLDLAAEPTGEWLPQHERQGFAWEKGAVVFALREDYDEVMVEVYEGEPEEREPRAERAIVVPFQVPAPGGVAISSWAATERTIRLEPGDYALRFETGRLHVIETPDRPVTTGWCRLTFSKGEIVEARILVADERLQPSYPLLLGTQVP